MDGSGAAKSARAAREPGWTVAIPTYQGARYVREAIASVVAQATVAPATPCRLIVVDDHSEDGTLLCVDLAAHGSGLHTRVMRNPQRLGLAGNWNRCMAETATEWLSILHQDDRWDPGHLWTHAQAAIAFPDAGLIASPAGTIDAAGAVVPADRIGSGRIDLNSGPTPDATCRVEDPQAGAHASRFEPGRFLAHLIAGNPLRCAAVSLRVSACERLGGFDPSWKYLVDWDLWLRLARAYPVVWLEPAGDRVQPLAWSRWHAANETHRQRRGLTDLEEVERLFEVMDDSDRPLLGTNWPRLDRARRAWLARAYLNRAQELGWGAGSVQEGVTCLERARRWDARGLKLLGPDWRGRIQLRLLGAAPGLVRGWRGSQSRRGKGKVRSDER